MNRRLQVSLRNAARALSTSLRECKRDPEKADTIRMLLRETDQLCQDVSIKKRLPDTDLLSEDMLAKKARERYENSQPKKIQIKVKDG